MLETNHLKLQVQATTIYLLTAERLTDHVRQLRRVERGEVTSTTLIIGILAALALAVGAIITMKVTTKANNIPTE